MPPRVPCPPGCGFNTVHASSRGPDPGPHTRRCAGGTWRVQVCCCCRPGCPHPVRGIGTWSPLEQLSFSARTLSALNKPLSEPASRGREGRRNPKCGSCSAESSNLMPGPLLSGLLREAQAGCQCFLSARQRGACLAGSPATLGANPPLLGFQFLMISQAPSCSGSLLFKHKMSPKL